MKLPRSEVRRVLSDISSEIQQIMRQEGVSWIAAQRIWYNRMKRQDIKWQNR